MTDNVKHPDHYKLMINGKETESIDFIQAILGEEGFKKFCRGNALKYLVRADKKGGAEDLKKARVYINWEINDDYEAEYEEQEKPSILFDLEALKREIACNNLEAAFNVIKDNCKGYGNCEGCRFCEHRDCMLLANEPSSWELPEGTVEQNTEIPRLRAEVTDLIKAAGTLKNYCENIVGEEELQCYDCVFNGLGKDECVLNGSLPCSWELPQEGEDEE